VLFAAMPMASDITGSTTRSPMRQATTGSDGNSWRTKRSRSRARVSLKNTPQSTSSNSLLPRSAATASS